MASVEPADFECPVCASLLYKPVTTPCGHTFCMPCLARALDHTSACPVCRTTIYVLPASPVNVLVLKVIKKCWPEQYAARCAEEGDAVQGERTRLPLFVLDSVVFPGQLVPLHIFEPHYRLMLRRALEGSRTFGVVYVRDGQVVSVGTAVEILNHVSLMDGRSLVQTVGRRRFEITEMGEVDGYAVGDVNYFDDLPMTKSNDATTSSSTRTNTNTNGDEEMSEEDRLVQAILKLVEDKAGSHWANIRAAVVAKFGAVPSVPYDFSMWLASVLPIDNNAKQQLLECRSTRDRLTAIKGCLHTVVGQCTIV